MASTYSTNLKIELQGTGENSGTWGSITNTNLGTALEQAVVGYGNPDFVSDANLTLTYTDTNASQTARALVLNVTSSVSLTATRQLIVPTIQKQYIVQNNTSGSQSITVKTSAGTGITIPNGRKAHLYVNGTDVIYMDDYVDINGGAIDGTPIGASSASTGAFTTLSATTPVAVGSGGTGASTLTGVLKGNGTSAFTAAVAGTDYVAPGGALGTPSSGTLTNTTGLPISTGVSGLGTGVATALAVNTGSSGAFVVNGGALGTPSSGTLTNATGLPVSTGVSGLGTGVATALAVNTGSSGAFVVNGGALGTPSSGTLTNATGLPLSTGVTGTLAVTNGGTGQTSYTDGQLLIGNTSGNTLTKATLTAGSGVTITNGNGSITVAATGSGGTVTSVAGTGTVNGITLTGTVTSTGNLTLGGTLSNVSLSSQVTGTLPVANGGTGLTATPTNGQLDIGNGSGFTRTTLTAGSNISITNGAGSITIASTSSGITTGKSIAMAMIFGF